MELRQYQIDLIDNIRKSINSGKKSVCAVLGCGGGKSIIQGCIAAMCTKNKNQVLFLFIVKNFVSRLKILLNFVELISNTVMFLWFRQSADDYLK